MTPDVEIASLERQLRRTNIKAKLLAAARGEYKPLTLLEMRDLAEQQGVHA